MKKRIAKKMLKSLDAGKFCYSLPQLAKALSIYQPKRRLQHAIVMIAGQNCLFYEESATVHDGPFSTLSNARFVRARAYGKLSAK